MERKKIQFDISRFHSGVACALAKLVLCVSFVGCGTIRDQMATDQLLLSDAVDRSVANIDFSPLSGESVFLDTQYIRQVKGVGFVNSDYIISSIRQQMALAGCLLQEDREEAKYIVEPRVGALGADGNDVNIGVPASQGLNSAASIVTGTPPLPVLPEISLARLTDDSAAAKIAVFAYHRETRLPVWQSDLSVARSTAYGKWIFGAGPIKSGSIYDGTQFASDALKNSTPLSKGTKAEHQLTDRDQAYRSASVWSEDLRNKLLSQEVPLVANLPDDGTSPPSSTPEEPPAEEEPAPEEPPAEQEAPAEAE